MASLRFLFPLRSRSVVTQIVASGAALTQRKEPCRLCGSSDAVDIFPVTFWDIEQVNLVGCPHCQFVQLDPMISPAGMQKGVYAYYLWQRSGETASSQRKNAQRNFRKGYAFARSLPEKFKPQRILELGPGSGWFLRGVRAVFPVAEYCTWDIVPEVAVTMAEEHGFTGLTGELAQIIPGVGFDMVIARDVIEHFADAASAIREIHALLRPGGLFHFITPNGHEDLWKFYVARELKLAGPAELLLNHVNYFDGAGLQHFLEQMGFAAQQYYTYDFSSWMAGIGWRVSRKLAAGSHGLKADATIQEFSRAVPPQSRVQEPGLSCYQKLWFRWKAWRLLRFDPVKNFGHEIHGVFRKT